MTMWESIIFLIVGPWLAWDCARTLRLARREQVFRGGVGGQLWGVAKADSPATYRFIFGGLLVIMVLGVIGFLWAAIELVMGIAS